MFLIDAIKPKVEKKLKKVFREGELEVYKLNQILSFRFRFAGGNKIFIQKKRAKPL